MGLFGELRHDNHSTRRVAKIGTDMIIALVTSVNLYLLLGAFDHSNQANLALSLQITIKNAVKPLSLQEGTCG